MSKKATQPKRFQLFRKLKNVKLFTHQDFIGLNGSEVAPVNEYGRKLDGYLNVQVLQQRCMGETEMSVLL